MMIKRLWPYCIVFVIFVVVFARCTQTTESPGTTYTQASTPFSDELLSLTSVPTMSITPMEPDRPSKCLNLYKPSPVDEDMEFSGVLGIILPPAELTDFQSLLNFQTLQAQPLVPLNNIRNIGFSPSGEWFAYQTYYEKGTENLPTLQVYLISSNGDEVITSLPVDNNETNGHWFSSWISDQYMLMTYDLPSENLNVTQWAFKVFDPFTGQSDQRVLNALPHWKGDTAVYFSPDMTRVAYVSNQPEGTFLKLWDTEHEEEIWEKPFISDLRFDEVGIGAMSGFGKVVTWSPDSSGLVFTTAEQTRDSVDFLYRSYFVDRDGKQERVLVNTSNRKDNLIYDGAWSPDGRYIASINRWSNNLFLFDFAGHQMFDLCSGLPPYVNEVLWSPDSSYLAFMAEVDGQPHLLMLDIYTGTVLNIQKIRNFFAAIWSTNEGWSKP
ncbi:MAG TPA: hypothetical protein PLD25_30325 [Chloroflexota bacterium]|nr:hypothetical protein [Chloroflexota bacterium]